MDIKNSSIKRNEAISTDLMTQLNLVTNILKEAYSHQKLPTIEELIIRTNYYIKEISKELLASSEHKIMFFLETEIYPLFKLLANNSTSDVSLKISEYEKELSSTSGILNKERKNWDHSVNKTNQMMANFIDEKQIEAQAMFPHYFERYKTDGLEYTIYIGDSISKEKKFNLLYLNNLRLWQFTTMCQMERQFSLIQPTLCLLYTSPSPRD